MSCLITPLSSSLQRQQWHSNCRSSNSLHFGTVTDIASCVFERMWAVIPVNRGCRNEDIHNLEKVATTWILRRGRTTISTNSNFLRISNETRSHRAHYNSSSATAAFVEYACCAVLTRSCDSVIVVSCFFPRCNRLRNLLVASINKNQYRTSTKKLSAV